MLKSTGRKLYLSACKYQLHHFLLRILQRNSKGGIQLLRLHLGDRGVGGGQGASIYKNMQIGEGGGSCQCERAPINYWKAYPDLQKERGIQKWAGIVVKSRKRLGAAQKDYHLN